MIYNFDNIVDRKGSFSVKWDLKEDTIPLWVADMDFHVAKEIEEALIKRSKHGVYGYSITPDSYYQAQIDWWKNRHNTEIDNAWILSTIGVIPALSSSVAGCVEPGNNVIVLSPVYQYFYSSVTNNNANVIHCPLINDSGKYTIDFDLLKTQAADANTTMLFLCNPHNPVGRVWTKDELTQLVEICLEHDIIIVSDEIHRDLTYERDYTPMLSIDGIKDNLITCTAPSKTFNIAGLKTANMVIPNDALRKKVNQALNQKEVIEPSVFGIDGLIAAYNHGAEWLDQLLEYLQNNRDFAIKYLSEKLPDACISPLEGTYLLWVDLEAYNIDSKNLEQRLIEEGVFINGGYKYGDANTHIRINLATSQQVLKEGLTIIANYLNHNR